MQPSAPSTTTSINPQTRIGKAELAVASLERSVQFYTQVIGLQVLNRTATTADLGTGSEVILIVREETGAKLQPRRTTGLFHIAILVPSRPDLGRVLINLLRYNMQIGGGDHFVSEAIYLNDPDGNGLEIYRDRPRTEWTWNGDFLNMGTEELDFAGIIASVPDQQAPFTGMPAGTTIGHMHLKVGNIAQASAFYHDALGFDIVVDMGSALFVSAGGYHHHIGMNIWHSQNAPRPPADSVGLRLYTLIVPDATALNEIAARLTSRNIAYELAENTLRVDDPWGNAIAIYIG